MILPFFQAKKNWSNGRDFSLLVNNEHPKPSIEAGRVTAIKALRKMCLMPSQTLEDFVPQMKKKGRFQEGMDADIVIFDPATISDVGTSQAPNQPAVGVRSLLVKGTQFIAARELIMDASPGQPVRRPVTKINL